MSLFEKRVEAAARVIYDAATALVPDAWDHETDDEKAWWLNHAREVLLAADAVVTEEQIAEALAEHVLGEANGGTASWAWINCSCRHRIEIAGVTRERVLALGRRHQAEVLTALFRGGAK